MIDLLILIPLIVSILAILSMTFDKVNWFIATMGIVLSFGIAYYSSEYSSLLIQPLSNCLWYGYDWNWLAYFSAGIVMMWGFIGIQSGYYLYMSNGKKVVG